MFQITHELIFDDGNADLIPFAQNLDTFAIKINVSYIEAAKLFPSQSEPEEGFHDTAIPEIVGCDDLLFHFGWF